MYMTIFTVHWGQRNLTQGTAYNILSVVPGIHDQENLVAKGRTKPEKSNSVFIHDVYMYYIGLVDNSIKVM